MCVSVCKLPKARTSKVYLGEKIVLISTPGIILMPNLRAASRASGMPDIVS